MITIYDSYQKILLETNVSDRSSLYCGLDNKNSLTLHFALDRHVDIPVGAWCYFQGNRYEVMSDVDVKMNHTENYDYTVVFYSHFALVSRYKVMNTVDGRLKFDLVAKPHEHLQMIVENLNSRNGGWSVGSCVDSVEKLVSYNHTNCEEALLAVADAFKTEIEVVGKTISLKKVEYFKDDPLSLSYGKGNGFRPGIQRTSVKDGLAVQRLFVQGGSRNISLKEYGSSELHLPKGISFRFDRDKFDGEEGFKETNAVQFVTDADGMSVSVDGMTGGKEDSLDLSEVYPSRIGKVTGVVFIYKGKEYTEPVTSWRDEDWNEVQIDIVDSTIPDSLDFNECLMENNEPLTVVFQSGMLTGRELDATYVSSKKKFEIEKTEYDGQPMPQGSFIPKVGDTYAVFNVYLPKSYISDASTHSGAEYDLLREASRYLYEKCVSEFTFAGEIDGMWAKKNWDSVGPRIKIGSYVSFTHDKMFPEKPALVRIVGVTQYVNNPHYPKIELSNSVGVSTVSSRLNQIENKDAHVDELYENSKRYTKRRWSDIKQTIQMLSSAFDEFAPGIDPVTVQTMTLVAGDQRSQFRFTKSRQSLDPVPCPIYYDSVTRMMMADAAALVHFTLGIDSLTAPNVRVAGDYMSWNLNAGHSAALDDGSKSYYVCVKAQKQGIDAELYLTETPVALEDDEFYYLYVGILNSESGGSRDFATIYGFTEVAPGRIVTNVIRSADGTCVFDLENNTITGPMKFLPGTSGIENIEGIAEVIENSVGDLEFGKYNLIRNSGFTGDFVTESLGGSEILDENKQLFSDPLRHWTSSNATVQDSEVSESGKECVLTAGLLIQTIQNRLISGEKYVFSFRAKGESLTYSVGGVQKTITLTDKWTRYVEKFTAVSPSQEFAIHGATCIICEVQLERGTVVSAWGQNIKDNQSEIAKYQSLDYLQQAIKNGNTDIMGGLILSNLIMLGNPGKSDNTAGISGIRNDDNDVAFWGGGTFSQAIATVMKYLEDPTYQPTDAEVANMAKVVITHGGRAILNDIILRGIMYAKGGKIGNLEITEDGLRIDTAADGRMNLDEGGLRVTDGKTAQGTLASAKIGSDCGYSAIEAVVGISGMSCLATDDRKPAAFLARAIGDHYAFYSMSGQFGGLRTKTRVVTSDVHLSISDFNVLVNKTSGTVTLTMPDVSSYEWPVDPAEIDGQEIIVETRGADVTLISSGANMYSHRDNNTTLQSQLNITSRGVFRMKYYHDAGMWTFAWIDRYTD